MSPDPIDQVPSPVLFNSWKHHAGAIRRGIAEVIRAGAPALETLPAQLAVIGNALMDLYTGNLSPADIARMILLQLRSEGHLDESAYRAWLDFNRAYRVATLADGSVWVLRFGEEGGRYVHIHPGRRTPHTMRVRAPILKTSVMAAAYAGVHRDLPIDVALVNQVRQRYLGLPPVRTWRQVLFLPARPET